MISFNKLEILFIVMKSITWILFYSLLSFTLTVNAGEELHKHFRYWTSLDGFEESYGVALSVTPRGDLIVNHGSVNEMSYLDGYQVHKIPCPAHNAKVRESAGGQLWSICWEDWPRHINGALKFQSHKMQWRRYAIEELLSAEYPFPFLPIDRERVLFLLPYGLIEFNSSIESLTVLKYSKDTQLGRFTNMIQAWDGSIWITAEYGVALLTHFNNKTNGSFDFREFPTDPELNIYNLNYPANDRRRGLYVAAVSVMTQSDVIVHFDGRDWFLKYTAEKDRNVIGIPGTNDDFWIIEGEHINNYTLIRSFDLYHSFHYQKKKIKKGKVLSYSVMDYAVEDNGIFWLGLSHGIARWAPQLWSTPLDSPMQESLCSFIYEVPEQGIWFGQKGSLTLFNNKVWKTFKIESLATTSHTHCFCVLPGGDLAIQEFNNYDFFNPYTRERYRIPYFNDKKIEFIGPRTPGSVFVVIKDIVNSIRVESYDGKTFDLLFELPNGWNITENEGLFALINTFDGAFWMGSSEINGLARYKDGEYQLFGPSDGIDGGAVFSLLEIEYGKIWIGGRNAIIEYDGNTFRTVRPNTEMVHKIIQSHEGDIWAATFSGVHRFYKGSWITYTAEDGLPDAAIRNIFEDSQGRIWVGTSQGISRYHPEADRDPPRVFLDSENIREVSPKGEVKFTFSGIDKWKYCKADRLLYSYSIDDDPWQPFTEKNSALLTNQSPGTHYFHVRAMDRNGNQSEIETWEFYVIAPLYKRIEFILSVGIGCTLILAALVFGISRHLKLESLVSERTKQLRSLASEMSMVEERERRRIASDLHDRIGHELATCQMQIETLQKETKGQRTENVVQKIRDSVKNSITDVRELTFEISPTVLYEFGLVAAVDWLIRRIKNDHGLQISFTDGDEPAALDTDIKGILFRSVRELLFNVVKHAQTKEASVVITNNMNNLRITIEDHGVGFTSYAQSYTTGKAGFGLFSVRERIEHLGGKFECRSIPGSGTRIDLMVPLDDREGR